MAIAARRSRRLRVRFTPKQRRTTHRAPTPQWGRSLQQDRKLESQPATKKVPKCEAPPASRRLERDCRDLYCLSSTAICATVKRCVSCCYKLCVWSSPHTTLPRNVRPEECKSCGQVASCRLFAGCRVLTVGDGDLSFSVALKRGGALVHATSLASNLTDLQQRYHTIAVAQHAAELQGRVAYGVDATRLADYVKQRFDRVCFNFPCVDVADGLDGQSPKSQRADAAAVEANTQLVKRFALSALDVLESHGELLITHKTFPPYSWWRVSRVAAVGPLRCRGAIVMDRSAFPPYVNRRAKSPRSFSATDAVTYVFCSAAPRKPSAKPPPTLPPGPASPRDEDPHSTPFFAHVSPDLLCRLTPNDLLATVDARRLLVRVTPEFLAAVRLAVSPAPPSGGESKSITVKSGSAPKVHK